jgi:hypothetical protein
MDGGAHSFSTMSQEDMAAADYVMFNEAVRAAFAGINPRHIDMDIAGLVFRNAAIKYRFVLENHLTFIALHHVIPRDMISRVFDCTAKRLCMFSALDKVRTDMAGIPENNARKISIQQNLVEAIEADIRQLR